MTARRNITVLALILSSIIVVSSLIPVGAAPGVWRLISPTEYTSFPSANMNGVYMLNGGTSGKGSGNGWGVSGFGLIFHWDGFSWNQQSTPTDCQLNSVSFGGPLSPLTTIRTDSGWAVGGVGGPQLGSPQAGPGCSGGVGRGESLYFNGAGWASYPVPTPTPLTTELRGVFLVQSGGPGGFVQAYAVGTESGADGAFWVWNGVPSVAGAWSRCAVAGCGLVVGSPVNSVYMTHCTGTPCAADDGIAVGNAGTIFRFSAGAFTPRASPVGVDLNGVAMSSRTNGWAVGDSCTIVRTVDGDTWTGPVSPGACAGAVDLRGIVMVSSSEAWAVGDMLAGGATILHGTSLDSAPTWVKIPVNQIALTTLDLNGVTFAVSGGNMWAVGGSGVAAFCLSDCSSVSGSIWSTTTSPVDTGTILRSVFMVSDSDGFAVGDLEPVSGAPTIIRWNGGTFSWIRAPFVAPLVSSDLFGVHMTSSSSAWAVGGTGGGVATSLFFDGSTWTGRPTGPCGFSCVLRSVFMMSASNSWAVGSSPGAMFPAFEPIAAPVAGGGVIMHSTSPLSFAVAASPGGIDPSPGPALTNLYSVFFDPTSGGLSGWAGGGDGFGGPAVIVHTTNGGADGWGTVLTPGVGLPVAIPAGAIIRTLYFQDGSNGWAGGSGMGNFLLRWDGISWTLVPFTTSSGFTADIYGIHVLGGPPATDGWAVGFDTVTGLPVTINFNGVTWTEVALTPAMPPANAPGGLASISLRSSTNGLAVGSPTVCCFSPPLSLVFHLDPPGGVQATTTAFTTTPVTTTPQPTTTTTQTQAATTTTFQGTTTTTNQGTTTGATTSATTSSTTSEATTGQATTSQTTSSSTTSSEPTTTLTNTGATTPAGIPTITQQLVTISPTTTVAPLTIPAIPGFPWESILAGLTIGLGILTILRRRRLRDSTRTPP